MKPHSPAAERNRDPILGVLRSYFGDRRHVLEIGSGTGQHAVHFAAAMPWLQWQPTDHPDALPGIEAWRAEAALPNLRPAIALQSELEGGLQPTPALPPGGFDAVFTANTLHIMGWPRVQALFASLPALMAPDALLAVYGPFNIGGQPTSESNRTFDAWLKNEYAEGGIRDLEAVQALAAAAGLREIGRFAMPANNFCLLWRRGGARVG
ncbi:hypothetical protein ARC20_02035 [Stenotrophomonas panacihumi]|uniref:Methylase n=1 Tax=Stenotrophomonas panacihumi TaxID=676599 RepID=A0A0Q9ZXT9_9GAMM|nr:DUF938 domain-containing protein [Stenotrophomonas panacihumi]KRG37695.1 hypothetical protein ARC20_02035 [Stenotrophomonas panacihumi]PTN56131.1 DUF938 domain-containing protein [Stenotrophomonas panacihumi]